MAGKATTRTPCECSTMIDRRNGPRHGASIRRPRWRDLVLELLATVGLYAVLGWFALWLAWEVSW